MNWFARPLTCARPKEPSPITELLARCIHCGLFPIRREATSFSDFGAPLARAAAGSGEGVL